MLAALLAAYLYPISLAVISALVMLLERLFPWRKGQKQLRRRLWSDVLHLAFNGHFLGVILFGISVNYVIPRIDDALGPSGRALLYRDAAASWPLWLQIPVALIAFDFAQWCVHRLLHRIPLLWEFHKTHHSVVDGEMDYIVAFRFQWMEVVVYKSLQYVPLAFFGFANETILVQAIFGTLIGHLNHANLDLGHGWWRYILNSPRMHIWHHDYRGDARTTVNFGIVLSCWDWIFGTAKMPDEPPPRLGFPGVDEFPTEFFEHEAWPLGRFLRKLAPGPRTWTGALAGAVLIALGWWLHFASPNPADASPGVPHAPFFGEQAATSQPSQSAQPDHAFAYASSPAEADLALARFGEEASRLGFAHPEDMVSADELARALSSPHLAILDVRPAERVRAGHIPSAQEVYRDDFSEKGHFAKDPTSLEALLTAKGVRADSVVILYGDGGPEPYKLWWALRRLADFHARILDGGLVAWKAGGHPVAGGTPPKAAPGALKLTHPTDQVPRRWAEIEPTLSRAKLLDARSRAEWTGEAKHPDAKKPGRIPGSINMDWTEVLRSKKDPRLLLPDALKQAFTALGISATDRVVTMCQTGTRSSATYFALHEIGFSDDQIANYEGSWEEYGALDLPIATGD